MIHYLIVQMSCKNNCGRFYRDLTLKPSRPVSISHLHLKFILEEWINKQIRKAIQALRNVIKGLHADLRGKCRGKSHFNQGRRGIGLYRGIYTLFFRFNEEIRLFSDVYVYKTSEKVTVRLQLAITTKYAYLALRVKAYFCCKKQAILVLE